jgi:hypothetical protein
MIGIKKPREKHTVKNTNKTSTYFEGVMGFLMIIRKPNLAKMYMITGRSADITEIRTLSPESPKITNKAQSKAVIAERMQTIKKDLPTIASIILLSLLFSCLSFVMAAYSSSTLTPSAFARGMTSSADGYHPPFSHFEIALLLIPSWSPNCFCDKFFFSRRSQR